MYRIDTSTKAPDLFGAGKDGFKDGDAGAGIPATDLNADYFNELQETLAFVIETAGITLDKGDFEQLYDAIALMIVAAIPAASVPLTTGGTNTAYTLTPSPAAAVSADSVYDVKFHAAAGASPTLADSGNPPLALKYRDSSGALLPITATQVPINWRSQVTNNGTYWIVMQTADALTASSNGKHGADIASAGTIDLDAATGDLIDVTGTTTITAVTLAEGRERTVRFTGSLILTNGASLVLPDGANIKTAAGDFAVLRGYAAGVVRCVSYTRKSMHGADIVSAGTIDLDAATGDLVDVTGTTTITAVTLAEGRERTVRFTGILTFTNGASLVLPGGANITTAAGDFAVLRGYAAGVVRCVSYIRKDGTAVVSSSVSICSSGEASAGTDNTKAVSPLQLRNGLNASGSAPIYALRGFVHWNASSGTPTIGASGNISSLTDNGTGDTTINFSTALADAQFAVSTSVCGNYSSTQWATLTTDTIGTSGAESARSVSTVRTQCYDKNGTIFDPKYAGLMFAK